jgi:O-antigen/teichoic acid export membrane protein
VSLARHAGYLVVLRAASVLAGAVASVLVARVLGADGKGIVYLAFLLPQFLASVGGFGLRSAAIFFIGRGCDVRRLFRQVVLAGLGFGAGYVVAGLLLRDVLGRTVLQGLEPRWIHLAVALVPVSLLWAFADGVLHGLRRFGLYTVLQTLSLLLRVAGLVVFLLLVPRGIPGAMLAYAAATVIPALVTLVVVAGIVRPGGEAVPFRDVLSYGLRVQLGTFAQRANVSLDVFLINPFVGPAQVGLYSVAVMLTQMAWYVPGAVSQSLFPAVAGTRDAEAAAVTCRLSRFVLLVSLPTVGGLAAVAPWLVPFAFGEEFSASVPALWALLPGTLLLGVAMVLAQYLAGVGLPQRNSLASVVSFAVTLLGLFLLVPRYGILGAGLASSLAYGVHAGLVAVFFVRRSGRGWSEFLVPRREDLAAVRERFARLRQAPPAPEEPDVS